MPIYKLKQMKKSILVVLLLCLTILSCEEASPILDPERKLLETYGEVQNDTLYAIADTFIIGGPVSTGFSPKLLLGTFRDYDTSILLHFSDIPADTFRMDSVHILLTSFSTFLNPVMPVEAEIYRLTEDWENDVNTDASWQNPLSKADPFPISSVSFDATSQDTLKCKFEIPVDVVSQWQDTTGGNTNFGLLIDDVQADHIIEFASRESQNTSERPRIVYTYTDVTKDSTIRDTVLADRDASLIAFSGNFDENQIFISSGFTTRAFFKFDFSVLPENIAVTSVNFLFLKDTLRSLINPNKSQNMFLRNVTTNYSDLPTFEVDSSFTSIIFQNVILSDQSDVMTLDQSIRGGIGQTFIQSILNEFVAHESFLVQYSGEGNDISVYAIRAMNDPVIENRPQLHLQYYLIPEGRI